MKKTKIEWCDCTVNAVIGCTFGCKYCYAKKLNNRFGWVDDFSKPQFRPEQLKKLYSKRPQIIFMDSMSDIADWQQGWKDEVFGAMRDNPQHRYLFLSKRPEGMPFINRALNGCRASQKNVKWAGLITYQHLQNDLFSVDHILEDLQPEKHTILFKQIDWVIIGAETGNRKEKIAPKKEWVDSIVKYCKAESVPVFMKNSLIQIMGIENMLCEFPQELRGKK